MTTHEILRILKADRRIGGDLSYLKAIIRRADTGEETTIDLRARKGEPAIPVDASLSRVDLADDHFAAADRQWARYLDDRREQNRALVSTLRMQTAAAAADTRHPDRALAAAIVATIDAGLPDHIWDMPVDTNGNSPSVQYVIGAARATMKEHRP